MTRLSRLALPLIVLGALAGGLLLRDHLTFEALRDNRAALIAWRDANYPLAAAGYVTAYAAMVALSIPGATAMTLAGGFLFGLAPGAAMTVVAATLGATGLFLAARAGLGRALHARMLAREGALARMDAGLRANEASYLLLMRLLPAVPFFVANLAPAFLGVSLRNYALTTFFGIIPGTLVISWIGAGLGEVFARGGTPDLSLLTEPYVIGPILALAALAALPILLRARR